MNFIGTSYSYLNTDIPTDDVSNSEQIIPDVEQQSIINNDIVPTEVTESQEVPSAEPPQRAAAAWLPAPAAPAGP